MRYIKVAVLTIVMSLLIIPAAAVYAATATTTISSAVSSVISLLTTSGTVNINAVPTGAGVQTTASDTITVSTNDAAGYTLSLAETGVSTSLVSGSDTIVQTTGTKASPVALVAGKWGYRVDGIGGFGAGPTSSGSNAAIGSATFAAVPGSGSPDTLKTTSAPATSDTTTVWYSVAVDTSQPAGTYTNSVTYTATAN